MRYPSAIVGCAFALLVSGCATEYSVLPVADGSQQVRYDHGQATIYSETQLGAVQVTALGVNNDDRLGFGIAVANKSRAPSNFGVENLSLIQADGSAGRMLTSADLTHEAKVRAGWQMFGAALVGVSESVAAGLNARSTTVGTVYTPVGSASYVETTYNPAVAQLGQEEANAQMKSNFDSIKSNLDQTLASINGSVLQTTTLNPGDSYGGIAVANTLSSSSYPQIVTLHVNWNGEDHTFQFNVAKGQQAVTTQATQPIAPAAAVAPAPAAAVALTDVVKLPYGYTPVASSSPADPSAENAETPQPTMMSYGQWQKDKAPSVTHRTNAQSSDDAASAVDNTN